jgi:hypothetical protein
MVAGVAWIPFLSAVGLGPGPCPLGHCGENDELRAAGTLLKKYADPEPDRKEPVINRGIQKAQ